MNPEIVLRKNQIGELCRRFHVRRLELFGSAAVGRDIPGKSDIDFLVEFDTLPPSEYSSAYFGLLEALEDLFKRQVDLVVASTIENPYLLKSIEQTKELLYAA
jgi:predicted nucleotidyltransferase